MAGDVRDLWENRRAKACADDSNYEVSDTSSRGLAVAEVDSDVSETAVLGGKKLRPERPSRRLGDF